MVARTYQTSHSGRFVTITTIRRSVMPGSGRKEESRKATRKSPGAPQANASTRIRSAISLMSQHVIIEGPRAPPAFH